MRFAVFGAGGLGAYYGARLVDAGYEVSFIARGPHLEAMQKNGLKVISPVGIRIGPSEQHPPLGVPFR